MSGTTYLLKRFLHALLVIMIVMSAVFGVIRVIPGDPIDLLVGDSAGPATKEAIRSELGLDKSLSVQYVNFMVNTFTGDLGRSIHTGRSVSELLLTSARPTASIGLIALIIAFTISMPAGIISAVRQYTWKDNVATVISFFGISMPEFWLAIILVLIFSHTSISIFGYTPLSEGLLPWLNSIILPGFAAGVPYTAIIMRMTRSSMLETLNDDYILTAKAKGLSPSLVLFKHALQNALIPVITIAMIALAGLLAGVVAIEIVFGIQGIGRILISSLHQRDYPVVQGTVLLISLVFVGAMIVLDIVYTIIDPRIRYGGGDRRT